MHRLHGRWIELAVPNAGARRHALDIAGANDRAGAQTVAVLQCAADDVGDNFHIPMRVHAEPLAGAHEIFVDHAQRAEGHVAWIVIIAKRKRMPAIKPIDFGGAPLGRFADGNHCGFPYLEILLRSTSGNRRKGLLRGKQSTEIYQDTSKCQRNRRYKHA